MATGRPDFDVAIVGGGLSGLSLAVRLADLPDVRLVILEPRAAYRRDRTWSYWRLRDHPFRDAVAKSWTTWDVVRQEDGGRRTTTQTCPAIPYETIPADRLYASALRRLCARPNVALRMGCPVQAVSERPDRVLLATEAGEIEAGLAFDSRPPPAKPGGFQQRFLGQEVVVDRPVFDPGRVTLMDFAVPQVAGAVHFLYLLPTSPTEALVEDTWLAPASADLPDMRAAISSYLADRYGAQVVGAGFEEAGAIPMDPDLQAPVRSGRVVPIGTAGGAVKPSSGYAFLAIQRMADALAAEVAQGRRPAPFQPRGPVARWLDAVFVAALQRRPEEAPRIFESLFARCRPEALVRFLNDVGTPADTARAVAAVPPAPMIAAALSRLRSAGPSRP